ncbi:hypothetical protein NPIL_541601 [Nephila pilipes]|uniref:Uncharacterized protein n=1 Tax=Nephila pilipes TaxID=299642 RepID=A0A8X6P8N1_NEPPI|nr:hypothetical protein NPIL_541601 [Nephila pilipes]
MNVKQGQGGRTRRRERTQREHPPFALAKEDTKIASVAPEGERGEVLRQILEYICLLRAASKDQQKSALIYTSFASNNNYNFEKL